MHETTLKTVHELCVRHNQGDHSAAREFESRFGPAVRTIVRRALRSPDDPSPLARQVRRTAEELTQGSPVDAGQVDGWLGRRFCDGIFARLAAEARRSGEALDTSPLLRTVVAVPQF